MLRDYQQLIAEVDQRCDEIRRRYGPHITCKKGCPGNCCQRHITVFAIEAAALARALLGLSPELINHIQGKARESNCLGPCPLLEDGACLMYASRAVICRTHGYPILSEYRGHRSIGFCHRNFKTLPGISDQPVIELAPLNKRLTALNRRFMADISGRLPAGGRFSVGQALLLDADLASRRTRA